MTYIGIALIVVGVLILFFASYYAKTQNIKKEMKEYRELAASSEFDDSYEPPKPIDRVYDKKPINSFVSGEYERAEVLEDSEIDRLVSMNENNDLPNEDTEVLVEEEKEKSNADASPSEELTSILNEDSEDTEILDSEDTEVLSNEETELLGSEATDILSGEISKDTTNIVKNQEDVSEEKTDILVNV